MTLNTQNRSSVFYHVRGESYESILFMNQIIHCMMVQQRRVAFLILFYRRITTDLISRVGILCEEGLLLRGTGTCVHAVLSVS